MLSIGTMYCMVLKIAIYLQRIWKTFINKQIINYSILQTYNDNT